MEKRSRANNSNIIKKIIFKFKDFILYKNGLFWISLILTVLFVISPLVLQISPIKHIASLFLSALTSESYKSSFMESVGSILGIALTITGTLYIQKKIDERVEKEKQEKEANDVRYRIIVIYYDLKLAFKDIAKMYNFLVISAFSTETDKAEKFYKFASKIELYIDDGWIRNVASLHDVFDEDLLEQIFLIYGDICSIKAGLKSNNYSELQVLRVATLICHYFNGIKNGEAKLISKYIEIFKKLKSTGKILENNEN